MYQYLVTYINTETQNDTFQKKTLFRPGTPKLGSAALKDFKTPEKITLKTVKEPRSVQIKKKRGRVGKKSLGTAELDYFRLLFE
jgi:hypothetical protein